MARLLSDLVPKTTVTEAGDVELTPPADGAVTIKDSTGSSQIEVTESNTSIGSGSLEVTPVSVTASTTANFDAGLVSTGDSTFKNATDDIVFYVTATGVVINGSAEMREFVSTINDDGQNGNRVASVQAVINWVNTAVSGALEFVEIESKAEFDTFLTGNIIAPSLVFVTDTVPFDYTDTHGNVGQGLTWWMGIVFKEDGEPLSTSTLYNSNSLEGLTGAEIAAALYAEPDTNRYDDAAVASVATIPNKLDITSNNVDLSLTNTGTGSGSINFINTQAPLGQQKFTIIARNDGSFDIESRDDADALISRWTFNSDGSTLFPGTISQGNSLVLDRSDNTSLLPDAVDHRYVTDAQLSSISNLPADTITELSGKLDTGSNSDAIPEGSTNLYMTSSERAKLVNTPTNTNTVLNQKANLSGAKFTGAVTLENDSRTSFVFRPLDDANGFNGLVYQTSAGEFTGAINRAPINATDNDLQFKVGAASQFAFQVPLVMTLRGEGGDAATAGFVVASNGMQAPVFRQGANNVLDTGSTSDDVAQGATNLYMNASEKTKLNNAPADTTTELAGKLDLSGGNLTGNVTSDSTITALNFDILDNNNNRYTFKKNEIADENLNIDGLTIKAVDANPAENGSLLRVESTGNSPRLLVEHLGIVGTSNQEIRVGIMNDGSGGRAVMEEGNWALIQRALRYQTDFPTLAVSDIVNWSGRTVSFIGVGAGTITLPQIVASNPGSNQVQDGEGFVVENYNSGSDITFNPASGQRFMVDNVAGLLPINSPFVHLASTRVVFVAYDLTGYASSGAFTWCVRGV